MAIQPIDLQTLFTQIDKVGKNQSNMKEGLQLQQAIHTVHQQEKHEEQIQSVIQTQDTGQGAERIKDRNRRNNSEQEDSAGANAHDKKERKNSEDENGEAKISFVKDPALGKNIDVSF
jgi:hypothetical protein